MKKSIGVLIILTLFLMPFVLSQESLIGTKIGKIMGYSVEENNMPPIEEGERDIGPSSQDINCVQNCVSQFCDMSNQSCKQVYGAQCLEQCNVEPEPEPENEDVSCMQKCVEKGCGEFDFNCQNANKELCEEECGMVKEPEAKNAEEQCIRDCVAESKDSEAKCENSPEGEKGGRVCEKCAKKCEYLYEGPCLDDKEMRQKEKECQTCKHCYGEPVLVLRARVGIVLWI